MASLYLDTFQHPSSSFEPQNVESRDLDMLITTNTKRALCFELPHRKSTQLQISTRLQLAFNYQIHLSCRLPVISMKGFATMTHRNDGYGSQW